jgi:hypothetical protein
VLAAPPGFCEALGALFEELTAEREGGAVFSPGSLAALASELGFAADEAFAAGFLVDCTQAAAAPGGPAAAAAVAALGSKRSPGAPAAGSASGHVAGAGSSAVSSSSSSAAEQPVPLLLLPLRRCEFVDFMVISADSMGVDSTEKLLDYIRVFRMLHMGSVRESAGVGAMR